MNGMGPNVCGRCLVLMKVDVEISGLRWLCPVCNKPDKNFGLWEFNNEDQNFIRRRSHLYKTKQMVQNDLIVVAKSRRPWPVGGDPNEIIRPWLEEHIGEQGVDWNWELDPDNFENIEYYFNKREYATLFELTW